MPSSVKWTMFVKPCRAENSSNIAFCKDVCMESTGKYWIPIYNILERTCNIVLAHSKYVKAIWGKKTDRQDAKWIADIFKRDLVAGSFIPPSDIRQLRDLVRYRWKLTNFTAAEKCLPRLTLVMSVPGIRSFAAIGIISAIGVDMSVFPTSKHLCSRAGLTPQNNESAGKKKTTRISRAGACIKPLPECCSLPFYKNSTYFSRIRRRILAFSHVRFQISSFRVSSACRCGSSIAWVLKRASWRMAAAAR